MSEETAVPEDLSDLLKYIFALFDSRKVRILVIIYLTPFVLYSWFKIVQKLSVLLWHGLCLICSWFRSSETEHGKEGKSNKSKKSKLPKDAESQIYETAGRIVPEANPCWCHWKKNLYSYAQVRLDDKGNMIEGSRRFVCEPCG